MTELQASLRKIEDEAIKKMPAADRARAEGQAGHRCSANCAASSRPSRQPAIESCAAS